ncbi:sensor histidine kinase [Sphaerisporangium corydalis]|uniref:histidine kinase n=1 Tax=Sphaerisporangium corydalis TaxID=1441875 RepID=A0ABV9EL04_9ACTN|nr:ATP-binding protein [Sphaerisporangium corydalis]
MGDTSVLAGELRAHPLFHGLKDDEYGWLSAAARSRELDDGEVLFTEGTPARFFVVLLEGELLISKVVDDREEVLARHSTRPGAETRASLAHTFTGELCVLAGDAYLATATSVGHSRVALYERDSFLQMLVRTPRVSELVIPVLALRAQDMIVSAGRRSTLASLGTLAAGIAHELNNPVAAVTRAIGELDDAVAELEEAAGAWGRTGTESERAAVHAAQRDWLARPRGSGPGDALGMSRLEESLQDWAEDHGLDDGACLAELLAERGADVAWLTDLAGRLREDHLPAALRYLSESLRVRSSAVDVREAGTRVSAIVRNTKEYTNLDRAPESDVDVREGLEATLAMLRPQLAGITVVRDYATPLPRIPGYPTELNQVWTNLIDNAAGAMAGGGRLRISARGEGTCVVVEIADTGPGIDPAVLPRVFEPFFTTKDIGSGTGLGLHLTHRIVTRRHRGSITVRSCPGDTRFLVRLPGRAADEPAPDADPRAVPVAAGSGSPPR